MINLFRINTIFDNHQANLICDEICDLIVEKGEVFPNDFMLTGLVSYILQYGKNPKQPQNIIFKTNNIEIYLKLAKKLDFLPVKNLIKYDRFLFFEYQAGNTNLCLAIEFNEEVTKTVVLNGIVLEDANLISKNYL